MEPHVLLAQLRSLLDRAPDFNALRGVPLEHSMWLGQAFALVSRWDRFEAVSFKTASDFLMGGINREMNIAKVFGAIHRAIADLELKASLSKDQAFGPGAVYDFFRALNEVMSSAMQSLLVVDPYLDATIFDAYLSNSLAGVAIRILLGKSSVDLKAAADAFSKQHGRVVELRVSSEIHDRLIFVDGGVCWVLGQSIKDAAVRKATYLAPLSPDVASFKLVVYERLWQRAQPI